METIYFLYSMVICISSRKNDVLSGFALFSDGKE